MNSPTTGSSSSDRAYEFLEKEGIMGMFLYDRGAFIAVREEARALLAADTAPADTSQVDIDELLLSLLHIAMENEGECWLEDGRRLPYHECLEQALAMVNEIHAGALSGLPEGDPLAMRIGELRDQATTAVKRMCRARYGPPPEEWTERQSADLERLDRLELWTYSRGAGPVGHDGLEVVRARLLPRWRRAIWDGAALGDLASSEVSELRRLLQEVLEELLV